jgi:hypothetical protein
MPCRLPPRHAPWNLKPANTEAGLSPLVLPDRLPPWRAPQNMQPANTEAGPSCLVVTGSPHVVAETRDLLVLPPMPREVFEELTSMFDDPNSILREPGSSEKACKYGWDLVPALEE